jgi:hypothetical protein
MSLAKKFQKLGGCVRSVHEGVLCTPILQRKTYSDAKFETARIRSGCIFSAFLHFNSVFKNRGRVRLFFFSCNCR